MLQEKLNRKSTPVNRTLQTYKKHTQEPEKERKRIKTTKHIPREHFCGGLNKLSCYCLFSLCTFLKRRIHLKIRKKKQRCKRNFAGNQHLPTEPFKPSEKTQRTWKITGKGEAKDNKHGKKTIHHIHVFRVWQNWSCYCLFSFVLFSQTVPDPLDPESAP